MEKFLKENGGFDRQVEFEISDRFDEDLKVWTIKSMCQNECEKLLVRCNKNKKKFETLVILESIVFPDLNQVELQSQFSVIGAENLLLKMLLAGEYEKLRIEVETINGGGDFYV